MGSLPEEPTITATTNSPTHRRSNARAGRIIAVTGLVVLIMIVGVWIPGVVGTAAAALLPWCGLALGVLSAIALIRARRVVLVLLVPILVWVLAIAPSTPGFASGAPDLSLIHI